MASTATTYPSTVDDFNRRFPNHAANTIHALARSLRNASGSSWTVQHLEACRAVIQPCHTPSILEPYMPVARNTVDACSAKVADLTSLSSSQISKMSHAELRANGGVFDSFYVALADVSRLPDLTSAANDRPQRDRKPINRPEYDTGQGLSSPASVVTEGDRARHPTSSPFTPHSEGGRDYDIQLDRTKHEAVSADLAAQFISSVLDRLSGQTSQNSRIEFSRAPKAFRLESLNISCTCQDDGSIIQRKRNALTLKWSTNESFLCSLEAKSRYTQADALGKGTISDRVIAQQVCEMLGSVMSIVEDGEHEDLDNRDRCRFLISIHQATIVFLHADFSPEYMAYIYSKTPPLELPHLIVHRSKDFDLEVPEHRKLAAETIVALAKLFIEQDNTG
ncbi:hypothetical protein B0J14DRAFT_658844 [Halenospora varia]|nr:hypothetical protein B0J14DRAFT_658844 [Halenospora varia]